MVVIPAESDAPPRLLTVPEAAERLGLPVSSAYELAASGRLPVVRFSARRVRVRPADLEAYVEASRGD